MRVARKKLIFEWNPVIGKAINQFVGEDSNFKMFASHALNNSNAVWVKSSLVCLATTGLFYSESAYRTLPTLQPSLDRR